MNSGRSYGGIDDKAKDIFLTHTLKLADSDIVNAFRAIAELYDLGAFPENNNIINVDQMNALYSSGKAAMLSVPSGNAATAFSGTPVEKDSVYGWSPSFTNSPYNQNIAIKMVGNCFAVGSNVAKDKGKLDTIIAFNKWRYTDEAVAITTSLGLLEPVKFVGDTSKLSPLLQQFITLAGDDKKGTITAAYASYNQWGKSIDLYVKYSVPVATLEGALADGSKKTGDIPIELAKIDKLIDASIKSLK